MTQEAFPQRRFSHARARVEENNRRPLEAVLRGLSDAGWSQGRIAAHLGVSRQTVNRWMREQREGKVA